MNVSMETNEGIVLNMQKVDDKWTLSRYLTI